MNGDDCVAPVQTLEKARSTTLGGARVTAQLKKRFPKTTALSLDYYLLSKPLSALLTCNDPEVETDEEYLAKAKKLAQGLTDLAKRLDALN